MSHITCQAERDENEAMNNCPHRSIPVLRTFVDDWTGEAYEEWTTESRCGKWVTLSPAKDKCLRCEKIFTY